MGDVLIEPSESDIAEFSQPKTVYLGVDVEDNLTPEALLHDLYETYLMAVQLCESTPEWSAPFTGGVKKITRETTFEDFLKIVLDHLRWRKSATDVELEYGYIDLSIRAEEFTLIERCEAYINKYLELPWRCERGPSRMTGV